MSIPEDNSQLYDILFELSNDVRHKILLLLKDNPRRVMQIAKKLDLISPEVSRHLSRLIESKLIQKDTDNYYHVTRYGQHILNQIERMEFYTKNQEYFLSHNVKGIPSIFKERLPEISKYQPIDNFMKFLTFINEKIKEATEYVWLYIDQYPITAVDSLLDSVERGVKIRIIEQSDLSGPNVTFNDKHLHTLVDGHSAVMVKEHDRKDVYLFVSDAGSAISFPGEEGFDYSGFSITDEESGTWGKDLFNHYWDNSITKTPFLKLNIKREEFSEVDSRVSKTVLTGIGRPEIDAQLIQKSVDNYDEVVLNGFFNIGTATININKSVYIRGEGRTENIPDTKIRKTGWMFPFSNYEMLFIANGEGIDVTIENIHVQDFNHMCLFTGEGNNLIFRKNRITLDTALGRGFCHGTFGATGTFGDRVSGINTSGFSETRKSSFKSILIEDNYLDFALMYSTGGGYVSSTGVESKPEYRPDLRNHETPLSFGININRSVGKVIVRNNTIRNMTARGIIVSDNWDSSEIEIINNTIFSEAFGAYPFNSHTSGVGIFIQSANGDPRKGGCIKIMGNKIVCDKVNYCGIAVYGQSVYSDGAGKLGECIVKDNDIHLLDGSVGVIIRKNDNTIVTGNKITGNVYYGVHLWGSGDREGFDLSSGNNVVRENNLLDLSIKPPDYYSDENADNRIFAGTKGKSITAQYWINKYSSGNKIQIRDDEVVIDEGEDNEVVHIHD